MTIEARFRRFDVANPDVFLWLERMAWQDVHGGAKRISIKALYERLRGHIATTGESYTLNNDYSALYARKLADEGGLGQYIELRERKAK